MHNGSPITPPLSLAAMSGDPRSLDDDLDAIMADPLALRAGKSSPSDIDHEDQATRLRALVREIENPDEFGPLTLESTGSSHPSCAADRPHWSGGGAAAGLPEIARAARPARAVSPTTRPPIATRIISVASGKGGVGKSNIAVNLSVAMSQLGLRVVLLDADLGTANADVLCGLLPTARLDHVVTPLPIHDAGRRTLADIAITAPGGFRLIPGSAGVAHMADLPPAHQQRLIADLVQIEQDCDLLVIDSSAGVGRGVLDFVAIADEAVIVTTPEPTSLADAYALLKCLHLTAAEAQRPLPRIGLVVNQVMDEREASEVYARFSSVARRFLGISVKMIGAVAQDLRVAEAVRARLPFVLHAPRAEATRDMRVIARFMTQELGLDGAIDHAQCAARPSRFARWLGFSKVRE